ncbi:MAG TPA: 7TM domain-containing protein [Gemmataceae bacterium]|nr:7TM domain-containing protein [Gemmataceae bacterium]
MPPFRSPTTLVALVVALTAVGLLWLRSGSTPLIPPDLPSAERQLVEFLLLLPVAALVCCIVRNVIGLHTFGTFAPALLGLAFREVESALGVFVLITVLSFGWVLRRALTGLNLLQVPRAAVMLSITCALLVAFVLFSHARGHSVARALPFLPLVIVTGLVERFWTLEEEDGTGASLRVMANTLLTSLAVFLVVRAEPVRRQVVEAPETLGLVIAGQLLLGRYTGYRVTELRRFRDLAADAKGGE